MRFPEGRKYGRGSPAQQASRRRNFFILRLRGVLALAAELDEIPGFQADARALADAAQGCINEAEHMKDK